jgi:hypothetical protein
MVLRSPDGPSLSLSSCSSLHPNSKLLATYLFDRIRKRILQHPPRVIQRHHLRLGPLQKPQLQLPRQRPAGPIRALAQRIILRARRLARGRSISPAAAVLAAQRVAALPVRRLGPGVDVVQEPDRVVPFERDALVGEPAGAGRRGGGVDQGGAEEGVEAGEEEGEVGEARDLDLARGRRVSGGL